jgi:ubiquinone/menaquinone biosynthesis C-methylase UbiE
MGVSSVFHSLSVFCTLVATRHIYPVGIDFSRIADRYDESRGGAQRGERFATELAPHLPPGLLLEVGVGTGVVAAAMRRPVIGVDIAAGMLSGARQRLGPCVVRSDGRGLPFRDGCFSGAYAVWVLHLVEDQAGLFSEIRRVLAPGGTFVVVTINRPAPDDLDAILKPMYVELLGDRDGRDLPERMAPLAEAAGLRVKEVVPGQPFHNQVSGPEEADRIERREGAVFWDLDQDRWREVVQPVIGRLRALGHQPIAREYLHQLLVLERKAR